MGAYTKNQFEADFPNDDVCLHALFEKRFGNLEWCPNCGCEFHYYRVKNRRCYACTDCRYQLFPTAGTVLHNTHLPLRDWFYVIYLFSISKNGVASREVERLLGVRPATALRMTHQIRKAMTQGEGFLSGIVEADEAYIGGRRRRWNRFSNKTPLLGAVERGGRVRVAVVDYADATTTMKFVRSTIAPGSTLHTDESRLYHRAPRHYTHHTVAHGKFEYVRGDDYTNTIEGFWGNFKPYLDGTHRHVSKKYLQLYVNEMVWKYNHRKEPFLYFLLLEAVAPPKRGFRRNVSFDP